MAGKIINSEEREKILVSLLNVVEKSTTRSQLVSIWRIGSIIFSGDTKRSNTLKDACAFQQAGFVANWPLKGGEIGNQAKTSR